VSLKISYFLVIKNYQLLRNGVVLSQIVIQYQLMLHEKQEQKKQEQEQKKQKKQKKQEQKHKKNI